MLWLSSITFKVTRQILLTGFMSLTLLFPAFATTYQGLAESSNLQLKRIVYTDDRIGDVEKTSGHIATLADKACCEVDSKQVGNSATDVRLVEPITVIHVNQTRSNLVVFTESGQVLSTKSLGAHNGTIIGAVKTVLSVDGSAIKLHTGKVVLISGSAPLSIGVRDCTISLKAHAKALVERTNDNLIGVTALLNNEPRAIKVAHLEKGQEDCYLGSFEKMVFYDGKCDKQAASSKDLQETQTLALKARHNNKATQIHACEDSEFFVCDQGHLTVLVGWMLMRSPTETTVWTDLGVIGLNKNTWLNLECIPGILRVGVCNIEGKSTVTAGKHHIPLRCGHEVLICDHNPTLRDTSASDGIMRRRVSCHPIGFGLTAVLSDFSILSLLSNAEHLQGLRNPESAGDKSVYEQLLRTSAILHIVTAAKGSYSAQPEVSFQRVASSEGINFSKLP